VQGATRPHDYLLHHLLHGLKYPSWAARRAAHSGWVTK
jgi:hypothetical protein